MSSLARILRRQYGRSSVAKRKKMIINVKRHLQEHPTEPASCSGENAMLCLQSFSSKPYKTFLPTSYSPKESCLKETENMLSTKELWQNVADYSMNEENQEWYQSTQFGDASSRDAQKEGLFQHFCQVVQKEGDQERPSESVLISIKEECREYTAVIGHQWQDLSLVMDMTHLSAKLSLTWALQEVKDDGSPICILFFFSIWPSLLWYLLCWGDLEPSHNVSEVCPYM